MTLAAASRGLLGSNAVFLHVLHVINIFDHNFCDIVNFNRIFRRNKLVVCIKVMALTMSTFS